jgi:hypothetical protein
MLAIGSFIPGLSVIIEDPADGGGEVALLQWFA